MENDKITIITPTYNRNVHFECRTFPLYKLVQHDVIDKMIVLWNNIGKPIPDSILDVIDSLGIRDKIEFVTETDNKLIDKFSCHSIINTESVLYLDDDIDISIDSINVMFSVWSDHKESIVGPVVRCCGVDTYAFSGIYNVVLTGCSMVNVKYLKMFTEYRLYDEIYHLVSYDYNNNGEDISFNFVVSEISGISNIYVKVPINCLWQPRGANTVNNGISSRPNHQNDRVSIVNDLIRLFGCNPLRSLKVV